MGIHYAEKAVRQVFAPCLTARPRHTTAGPVSKRSLKMAEPTLVRATSDCEMHDTNAPARKVG